MFSCILAWKTASWRFEEKTTTQVLRSLMFFLSGNAGLRSHFPAQFEPMEDRGERQIEEEEEEGRGQENDRVAEGPAEQAGVSVEAQIGRKLREIGDKFQQDHIELVSLPPKRCSGSWFPISKSQMGEHLCSYIAIDKEWMNT